MIDDPELTPEDLKKFKEIYLINCKEQEKFDKKMKVEYKRLGFNSLEEYYNYFKRLEDQEHIKRMKEVKRIYRIYDKGGYLTR